MTVLGQILKLTTISIFFSAAATMYIVDSDFYKNFLNNLNSNKVENSSLNKIDEIPGNELSREEIKDYRQYLRKTQIENTKLKTTQEKSSAKNRSIWQNKYDN